MHNVDKDKPLQIRNKISRSHQDNNQFHQVHNTQ